MTSAETPKLAASSSAALIAVYSAGPEGHDGEVACRPA